MKVLTAQDLSQNLTIEEMERSTTAHKLNIKNDAPADAVERMRQLAGAIFQPCRDHFGVPLFVSSGFRGKALNERTPGRSTNSQHLTGEAMDLDQDGSNNGVSNKDVFFFILRNLPFDQLIWEFGTDAGPDWVHVSYACGRKGRRDVRKAVRDAAGKVSYPLYAVR